MRYATLREKNICSHQWLVITHDIGVSVQRATQQAATVKCEVKNPINLYFSLFSFHHFNFKTIYLSSKMGIVSETPLSIEISRKKT